MQELFIRHYKAVCERGLIDHNTTDFEFFQKGKEELSEIAESGYEDAQEITDLMCVCANWLIHKGYVLESEVLQNVERQERRSENGE